jgi:hypothetical protein
MFTGAALGDGRRTARAIKVAQALATHAQQTLPKALPDWGALKATYRLLASPQVTHQRLIQPHVAWTRAQCRQAGHYVLPADSTQLDFTSHGAVSDLGRIGDDGGRGLMLHTTLALRLEPGALDHEQVPVRLLGLFDQQVWRRQGPPRKGREKKRARLERWRESQRWGQALATEEPLAPQVQWTYVGDREADIYELFAQRLPAGCEVVVRATHPRALLEPTGLHLPEALEQARPLGEVRLPLRARPGVAARVARLEVRAMAVTLRPPWRPQGPLPPIRLWAVQARELSPPAGVEGIDWLLLTNRPCASLAQARQVLRLYGLRWLIEEYHKALKSGTRIEDSQLGAAGRIEALLGIVAVVATRLLDAKLLGRARPEEPADAALCDEPTRRVLEKAVGRPAHGWTNRALIHAIARLGGFLGRRGDGDPGWQTIWCGWQVLQERVLGYLLALDG